MTDDMAQTPAQRRIAKALAGIAEADELSFDGAERMLLGSDLFHTGAPPAAILRPRHGDTLARCVAAACAERIPMVPRGGGISYSAGYVADRTDALMIDMRALDAVLHTDIARGTVTVQAGCTWRQLNDHLRPLGHRALFWGPASGRDATIGGSLSQQAILLGSGRFGAAGDNVEVLTVVTAKGKIIAARRGGEFEPGMFVGDCGALGIKLEATLPIMPLPLAASYAAWSFADGKAAIAAQAQIGARGIASECFLFDRAWTSRRQADGGEEIESTPGHRHHPGDAWELHAAFDGASARETETALSLFAEICRNLGGEPAGDGVIGYFHAQPFGPPLLLIGPEGRRWTPLHFIVTHDRHAAMGEAILRVIQAHAAQIARHDITWQWSSLLIGRDRVLLEPSLYWRDVQPDQAATYLGAERLLGQPQWPADAEARTAVAALRHALIEAGRDLDARHMQVGRLYPADAAFTGWSLAELTTRKRLLDPHGLMNPGVLGL